ncbi:MAG: hypothetical protein JXR30_03480 [Alphaproteobacteria bacterium]|nr:hypothetical protein [Alphaproteobacteria bacterium]
MRRILFLFLVFSFPSFAQETQVDPDRAYLNEDTMGQIDQTKSYDVFGAVRPFSEKDMTYFAEKWDPANISSSWQSYHGHLVRVDMLQSDRDLREMRLRFFHHQHDRYIDGDIPFILEQVSQSIIRQTCGRMASDVLIVYNRPSAEVSRPSPFYDYEIIAQGVAVREYGFRCLYSN